MPCGDGTLPTTASPNLTRRGRESAREQGSGKWSGTVVVAAMAGLVAARADSIRRGRSMPRGLGSWWNASRGRPPPAAIGTGRPARLTEANGGCVSEAIGAVLAFAVGVGISPLPIVAVILMLFSTRARVNGPLFLLGWVLGLTVVMTGAHLLADVLGIDGGSDATDEISWIKLALGLLLLVAAGRKWRDRPAEGDEPEVPGWMAGIDDIAPSRAFGLSLALSANPKNLALAAGAAASLGEVALTTGEVVAAVVTFVVVGSAAVAVAVVYDLLGGESARRSLDRAKDWLMLHNGAVMAVLFLAFGAVLISGGLGLRG